MAKGLLINLDRCTGCDSCIVACKLENRLPLGSFYNKVIAIGPTGTFPDVEKYWLPSQCQQCENPGCIEVCPTGALRSFDETAEKLGVAVVQKDRCVAYYQGCVECQKACPFEAIALDGDGHPVVDADRCNGCGVCEDVCPALVYRSFSGGTRRGIVVVSPSAYARLGKTVVEDESEMSA